MLFFRVWGSGFGDKVQVLGYRVKGSGILGFTAWVWDLGLRMLELVSEGTMFEPRP